MSCGGPHGIKKSGTAVISANGEKIASLTQRTAIFDVKERKLSQQFKALKNEWHIAISPDGSCVVMKGECGELVFCDTATGDVLSKTPVITNPCENGCNPLFSKDGKQLIDATWDGAIQIWDVASATRLERVEYPEYMVTKLAYAAGIDRYYAALTLRGDITQSRIVTFGHDALDARKDIAPPDPRVAAHQGWAEIQDIAVDPAAERLLVATHGRNPEERNVLLSLNTMTGAYALGELPSRKHFVHGLASGSGGLCAVSVHENIYEQGMGSRKYQELIKDAELDHLHFFETDTMTELCRWYWKGIGQLGFSEPDLALVVASADEPGGYLASYPFDLTAIDALRSSPRVRPLVEA